MKKTYWISYDLDKPGQDYQQLIARLREVGGIEILRSDWLVSSQFGAEAIRNDLMRFMDSNDRIFVAALTGEAAWSNPLTAHQLIKQALAA